MINSCLRVKIYLPVLALVLFLFLPNSSQAASLQASPNTGVYQLNSTFTVKVAVNSDGQPINAAEGTLKFNPAELSVVSVSRSTSVFNLWVTEPTFSNSAGTVTFSGGSPTGYTGSGGSVFTVTFKALVAGTSRISFTQGSVLANDGRGTNVLSAMNGGTYTIQAVATEPTPEVIEYVATANTPAAPKITSTTHPDPSLWSTKKKAVLEWSLPSDVVAMRTLLDSSPTAVPTKVYDTPLRTITIDDLSEGESYFHIQFKNDEGWGRVTHYRLAVDTVKPDSVTISLPPDADLASPTQTLIVDAKDATSPVRRFMVRIDDSEAFEFIAKDASGLIPLPTLTPGYHSVIIEAFDAAQNGQIGTFSFTLEAFEKPTFTEYPEQMSEQVIPVIRGLSRAGASVSITMTKLGSDSSSYTVTADETGVFTFIPEGRLAEGVYELSAVATDVHGAVSLSSDTIRIAVQRPGYLQIGSYLVSILSVLVPLIALVVVMVLLASSLLIYTRRFRRQVSRESKEALSILLREFESLDTKVRAEEERLTSSKKTKKLSQLELEVFDSLHHSLHESRERVRKEIEDVESLVDSKD
jgi:Cohesin domain/Bacterial Ig-like domain